MQKLSREKIDDVTQELNQLAAQDPAISHELEANAQAAEELASCTLKIDSPVTHGRAVHADRYRSLIEPHELTDQQADELLAALWSIMRTFVELGWGVESVQQVLPILGEDWSDETGPRPNDP